MTRALIFSTLAVVAATSLIGCGSTKKQVKWTSGRNELTQYLETRGESQVAWSEDELKRYGEDINRLGALDPGMNQRKIASLRDRLVIIEELKKKTMIDVPAILAAYKAEVEATLTEVWSRPAPDLNETVSFTKKVEHALNKNQILRGIAGLGDADRKMLEDGETVLLNVRRALGAQEKQLTLANSYSA